MLTDITNVWPTGKKRRSESEGRKPKAGREAGREDQVLDLVQRLAVPAPSRALEALASQLQAARGRLLEQHTAEGGACREQRASETKFVDALLAALPGAEVSRCVLKMTAPLYDALGFAHDTENGGEGGDRYFSLRYDPRLYGGQEAKPVVHMRWEAEHADPQRRAWASAPNAPEVAVPELVDLAAASAAEQEAVAAACHESINGLAMEDLEDFRTAFVASARRTPVAKDYRAYALKDASGVVSAAAVKELFLRDGGRRVFAGFYVEFFYSAKSGMGARLVHFLKELLAARAGALPHGARPVLLANSVDIEEDDGGRQAWLFNVRSEEALAAAFAEFDPKTYRTRALARLPTTRVVTWRSGKARLEAAARWSSAGHGVRMVSEFEASNSTIAFWAAQGLQYLRHGPQRVRACPRCDSAEKFYELYRTASHADVEPCPQSTAMIYV